MTGLRDIWGSGAVILVLVALCYFLPTFIALIRGKAQGGVFVLNLITGWTVVGWFVAFVWACSGRTVWNKRREERRRRKQRVLTRGQLVELLRGTQRGEGRPPQGAHTTLQIFPKVYFR